MFSRDSNKSETEICGAAKKSPRLYTKKVANFSSTHGSTVDI